MRHPDWAERLTAYLDSIRTTPYHPVTHNCGEFALGVVEAVTAESRESILQRAGVTMPDTEFGVTRVLAECGGMSGIVCRVFGEPSDRTLLAKRGDLAIMDGVGGHTVGVIENGAVLGITPKGVERHPLRQALAFWSI